MKLQRRRQADDALGYERCRFSQSAAGINRPISELVEAACRTHDDPLSDQTRKRLRTDAVGGKVFQPHHGVSTHESELVSVYPAALLEGREVHLTGIWAVWRGPPTVLVDAAPIDVSEVRLRRFWARPLQVHQAVT